MIRQRSERKNNLVPHFSKCGDTNKQMIITVEDTEVCCHLDPFSRFAEIHASVQFGKKRRSRSRGNFTGRKV